MDSERNVEKVSTGFSIIASEDFPSCDDDFGSGFKTCNKCQAEVPLIQFAKDSSSGDGRKGICKLCKSVYDKKRKPKISDDMVMVALERAAYKIIMERMK